MVWAKSSLHPAGTSREGSKAYPEFRLYYRSGCIVCANLSGIELHERIETRRLLDLRSQGQASLVTAEAAL